MRGENRCLKDEGDIPATGKPCYIETTGLQSCEKRALLHSMDGSGMLVALRKGGVRSKANQDVTKQ